MPKRKSTSTFNPVGLMKKNWKSITIAIIFLLIGLVANGYLGVISHDWSEMLTVFAIFALLVFVIGGIGLNLSIKYGRMDPIEARSFIGNMISGLLSGLLVAYLLGTKIEQRSIFDYILAIPFMIFVFGIGLSLVIGIKQVAKKK